MANVKTPEFRVSYPCVFKPKMNTKSKKEEYSLEALFAPGTDMSRLEAAVDAAIVKKWGADKARWPRNLKLPFKKQTLTRVNKVGDVVPNAGHIEGAPLLTLKNKDKPGVVDSNVQPIIAEAEFYAGCYAIASLNASAYDVDGARGVTFYLQNLQKTREGEPLSGRPKAEDDFAPISQGATSTDSFLD